MAVYLVWALTTITALLLIAHLIRSRADSLRIVFRIIMLSAAYVLLLLTGCNNGKKTADSQIVYGPPDAFDKKSGTASSQVEPEHPKAKRKKNKSDSLQPVDIQTDVVYAPLEFFQKKADIRSDVDYGPPNILTNDSLKTKIDKQKINKSVSYGPPEVFPKKSGAVPPQGD